MSSIFTLVMINGMFRTLIIRGFFILMDFLGEDDVPKLMAEFVFTDYFGCCLVVLEDF